MNKRILIIMMAILCVAASVGFASAQDNKMKSDKMQDKMMMSEMEKGPHHRMMSAYRQTIVNFAAALSEMAKDEKTFNADFARTAVAEIKRGAEMMNGIHQKHSAMMSAEMLGKMKPMMEKMNMNRTSLNEHISALEKIMQSEKPNLKEIGIHADAIISQFGEKEMSDMKM